MIEKEQLKEEAAERRRWTLVFTELCSDCIYRPIWIHPHDVMNVRRLEPPITRGDYFANTSILYEGRAVLLLEMFRFVISALGSAQSALDMYNSILYFTRMHLEEKGLTFWPEFEQLKFSNVPLSDFPEQSVSTDTVDCQ